MLAGLKDFQRSAVDYAFDRLFLAPDSTHRFLVADEVGLGKTMVARGIVARAIDHLQRQGVERIDVIYICSNMDIARQNISRISVVDVEAPVIASRLTLLPSQVNDLANQPVNLVALTPATSFDRGSAMGVAEERVLLYALLREIWGFGRSTGPKNVLQGTVRDRDWFRWRLDDFAREEVDDDIARRFDAALAERARESAKRGDRSLRDRFDELASLYKSRRDPSRLPWELRRARSHVIAELRALLAATCVELLEPDLVILDEFQRFKHLLTDDESDAAQLARTLFDWRNVDETEHARVLLLSATPYRMYTVRADGQGDDHHEDFLATVRFLYDDPGKVEDLRSLLAEYKAELYGVNPERSSRLETVQQEIEHALKLVMTRTERLAVSGQRNGMLRQCMRLSSPRESDVRHYLQLQDIARIVEQPDMTELWKSAPYLMNFLDGYKVRARFDEIGSKRSSAGELVALISNGTDSLLDPRALERFETLDPGTPRLRELATDLIDSGAWRMLWIPPALPYYRLGGAYAEEALQTFTKRLVFSSWRAVPRSVAGILSYLADRAISLRVDAEARNSPEARRNRGNRLQFTRESGRLTGMPVLAMLFPSMSLARHADPADFARERPEGSVNELRSWAEKRLTPLLGRLPTGNPAATADERWYWAAPLLLDRIESDDDEWWNQAELERIWSGRTKRRDDAESRRGGWGEHVALAADFPAGQKPLGPRPSDLVEVLALHALGSPGVLALRSLCRVTGAKPEEEQVRNSAGRVAWALRSLFNTPEATSVVRAQGRDPFWRGVLHHSIEGGLQPVLDEFAHMLLESEGLQSKTPAAQVAGISTAMVEALGLRASRSMYSEIAVSDGTIKPQRHRLHLSFAARFGEEETVGRTGEAPARPSQLRAAFNSPFWPFALVSTSVGQEGLDFHPYCHVVVHWNLPTNPVDLEQREGRVHRYKGHAVRRNVASRHAHAALQAQGDPWAAAFGLAVGDRAIGDGDLVPFWVYRPEGGAWIERHVLALPLSRELERLDDLRRSLAIYRLAFGQARQDDIVGHLVQRLGEERATALANRLRIDLRPQGNGASPRSETPLVQESTNS